MIFHSFTVMDSNDNLVYEYKGYDNQDGTYSLIDTVSENTYSIPSIYTTDPGTPIVGPSADTQGNEQLEMYDISDPFYAIMPFDNGCEGEGECVLGFGEYDEENDEYATQFTIHCYDGGGFEIDGENYTSYFSIDYYGGYYILGGENIVSYFFLITPIQTVARAIDGGCARFIYPSDVIFS